MVMMKLFFFFFVIKIIIDYLAINRDEPIEIAYVPSHLYHVMFELFKVRINNIFNYLNIILFRMQCVLLLNMQKVKNLTSHYHR